MATPRKTTAPATPRPARKRTAAAPDPQPPASSAPIKLYSAPTAAPAIEMVPLFSIDDVDHCIPKEPNALMALRFLEKVKSGASEDMAMGYLLEDLLGPESYRALLAFKGHMTPTQLGELFQAAQAAVVGLVEVPKGS